MFSSWALAPLKHRHLFSVVCEACYAFYFLVAGGLGTKAKAYQTMTKALISFLVTAAIAFCLAGCNPYVQQLQQLDKAHAAGQVDNRTYWKERYQLEQEATAWQMQQAANSRAMSAALSAMTPPPVAYQPVPVYQPQFIPLGHSRPPIQNFSGTIYGPNGQLSTYNGMSY